MEPQSEYDTDVELGEVKPRSNAWPGVIGFLGLLTFVYLMTALFVR